MRDQIERFGDARVAVVTFADPARLAAYRAHLAIPFDVVADPGETRDLATSRPDLARELQERLRAWRRDVGAQEMTVRGR